MKILEKVFCDDCGKEFNQIFEIINGTLVFTGGGSFYKGKELCIACTKRVESNLNNHDPNKPSM